MLFVLLTVAYAMRTHLGSQILHKEYGVVVPAEASPPKL